MAVISGTPRRPAERLVRHALDAGIEEPRRPIARANAARIAGTARCRLELSSMFEHVQGDVARASADHEDVAVAKLIGSRMP